MSNFHKEKKKFLQSIRVTSDILGFSDILIEKDYYCSLILNELFQSFHCPLVFRGGTLLNKAYVGFYRLSEDLDFSIPDEPKISKREKRHAVAQVAKKYVIDAIENLPLDFSKKFKGHSESRFYTAEVEYNSVITRDKRTIKIEFGIQEKIWERETLMAKTILVDPITHNPIFPEFRVVGLSLKEVYSEKIRAALSRKKPAIRDIFDIHYAIKRRLIEETKGFIKIHEIAPMVKYKLKILNRTVDLSDKRKEKFLGQLQTELKPVLRQKDFEEFDFEQAWDWLKILEQKISESL